VKYEIMQRMSANFHDSVSQIADPSSKQTSMGTARRTPSAAAGDLTLYVLPKMRCNASRAQKFSQIGEKKIGQELKSRSDRRVRVA